MERPQGVSCGPEDKEMVSYHRRANAKYRVTLKSNTVKQHFHSHCAVKQREQGHLTAITAEDEERMVQTILLMCSMKLPTERTVLKLVF
jgi:hypothetical protein